MKTIKHGMYEYPVEEEGSRTLIYHDDGEIKLSIPMIGLSDELLAVMLDCYELGWKWGLDRGKWQTQKTIRDILGI